MRLLGKARFGVYRDECEGIHPSLISKFYGADSSKSHRKHNAPGAGHPPDEDINNDIPQIVDNLPDPERVAADVVENQMPHVRHEGVQVADDYYPFTTESSSQSFFAELHHMVTDNIVPVGYNVAPQEWPQGQYPETETLSVGHRRKNELIISLKENVWQKRSVLWAQAMYCLTKCTMS